MIHAPRTVALCRKTRDEFPHVVLFAAFEEETRHLKTLALFAALLVVTGSARADFPEHAIEFVVPFPAGGTLDIVARKFAESFAEAVGQSVVVLNRDGASGVIGTQVVSSASPDGYTLAFDANGPLTVQPSLHATSYSLASFRPLCQVFSYSYALAVAQNSPISSLKDFVARAKGGTIKYAFGGVGTAPQFAALNCRRRPESACWACRIGAIRPRRWLSREATSIRPC